MINKYVWEAWCYNYLVLLPSHLYSIRVDITFKYKLSNTFRKCVFNISGKIYYTGMRYQYYKTTNINNARSCGFIV